MEAMTVSGTPAFAESETKVWRSEWNVASGVARVRPSIITLVFIPAALKINSSECATCHRERR